MKKLLSLIFFLWASVVYSATVPSTGFFTKANCATIVNPATNSVVCLQTTTTGGRIAGKMYIWNGSVYTEITGGGGVPVGPITTSGLTQSTGKLLGRGTASTGAIEEITLGTNLSLSGTTLNASAGTGGYATVQEEGSDLTQRTKLNFIGSAVTCVDDAGNTRTNCTVTGGGSSGAMTLVSTQTVTGSSVQDVTWSSLDGNADGYYEIWGNLISGHNSADSDVGLRINGDTTANIYHVVGSSSLISDYGFIINMANTNTNKLGSFRLALIPTTGNLRSWFSQGVAFGTTQIGLTSYLETGVYNESATNITSLTIHGAQSDSFAVGSIFSLYKIAK